MQKIVLINDDRVKNFHMSYAQGGRFGKGLMMGEMEVVEDSSVLLKIRRILAFGRSEQSSTTPPMLLERHPTLCMVFMGEGEGPLKLKWGML